MSLDVNKYKKELRTKLAKPSLIEEKEQVEKRKSYLVEGVAELSGGALDDLRARLFGTEADTPETDQEIVPDDSENGEGIMLGDPTAGNDPTGDEGDKAPMDMGIHAGDGKQILHDAEEELGDLATDTVHEVLLYLKDLRDKFKQEDPKKAQLVRKMYDHILKGKEKIVAEMIKAEEEANLPQ